jgi:hypothetical protein
MKKLSLPVGEKSFAEPDLADRYRFHSGVSYATVLEVSD